MTDRDRFEAAYNMQFDIDPNSLRVGDRYETARAQQHWVTWQVASSNNRDEPRGGG